ncbi:MAG: tetratricopeptide repeat protein [Candidatus Hodarchaeales archaeon]
MTISTHEKFQRLELLLNKGDYKNALELVETISSREIRSTRDNCTFFLLESRLRTKTGELHKARSIVEKVLSIDREEVNLLQVLDAFILKAEISWRLGNFDEGLLSVKESEKLLVELGKEEDDEIKKRKMNLLNQGGIIYWYIGNLDQATVFHKECLAISEEDNDKQGIADSLNNLGLIYQSKGEFNLALEYYQRSLTILEDLGDKEKITRPISNIGIIYSSIGDQDLALKYLQKKLDIVMELDNKPDIAMSLINVGAIYRLQGDLSNALEYYQRGQRIYEEINNKKGIALALNNLGDVYQLKGNLDLALEYYQKSLAMYEELGIKQDIAMSLVNIGELYRMKRNPDMALRHYNRSLALYEELKNDPSTATVLYELLWLALDCKEPTLAQQHLEKLQQIKERTDNRIVRHRYLIAKALFLKSHKRTLQKMKAEEILAKVVEEESVNHALTVTAMIHLCDLLLFELKMTGEKEILDEVKNLTKKLLNIAEQQSSYSLLTETYLLQSKLALLELDIDRAQQLLDNAKSTADEKGLLQLAKTITHERNLLLSQVNLWERIIDQEPSMSEIAELTQIDELIERMIRKRVHPDEEEVQQYADVVRKAFSKQKN